MRGLAFVLAVFVLPSISRADDQTSGATQPTEQAGAPTTSAPLPDYYNKLIPALIDGTDIDILSGQESPSRQ